MSQWLCAKISLVHSLAKRHQGVVKTSPFSHEGCLTSILRHVFDLMVPREPINERVCFLATYIIHDLVSERGRERIMHTSIIQFPEIYAYPYFLFMFIFLNHYWGCPIRFFHLFNNTYCEHLISLSTDPFLILRIKAVWSFFHRFHIQSGWSSWHLGLLLFPSDHKTSWGKNPDIHRWSQRSYLLSRHPNSPQYWKILAPPLCQSWPVKFSMVRLCMDPLSAILQPRNDPRFLEY